MRLLQRCLPLHSCPHGSCFCSINVTHYAAVAGGYYGWSTPYNYLDAYQMQLDTNVLMNGTCLASNDTYDMVECPSGTFKLPQSDIEGLCSKRGLPCPPVSQTALLPAWLLLLLLLLEVTHMCFLCLPYCINASALCWLSGIMSTHLQLTRVPRLSYTCFKQKEQSCSNVNLTTAFALSNEFFPCSNRVHHQYTHILSPGHGAVQVI